MSPEQLDKELREIRRRLCCISSASSDNIFPDVPVYADNAAALLGGLEVGAIYRTGDVLKIVH